MSRPIYTFTLCLLIHGFVMTVEGLLRNNEVTNEDLKNLHLGEILDRLTQLEDQYAELKEENSELKRLKSRTGMTDHGAVDGNTPVKLQHPENGDLNTGDGSFNDVPKLFDSFDSMKNDYGGTEHRHGTTPMNEVNRNEKTNGITTQHTFKFYPSVRELVAETANQNFNVPDIASPQDYLQVDQRSKSTTKEDQRLQVNEDQGSYNLKALSGQVKFLTDQFENLKSRLPMATDLAASGKCVFSVSRSLSLLGKSRPQNITFDFTLANKGAYFDIDTGVFTCNKTGIYYFSFTMRSYDNKTIGVTLLKNGEPEVSISTDPSDRKVMQTQSLMLRLENADQVWLQLGGSPNFAIYSNKYHYATFNGISLYTDK
ncbi:uncharacterized protein LOC144442514 [Glandiceps talaboti]